MAKNVSSVFLCRICDCCLHCFDTFDWVTKRASYCNYELVVPLIPKASLPEQVLEEN